MMEILFQIIAKIGIERKLQLCYWIFGRIAFERRWVTAVQHPEFDGFVEACLSCKDIGQFLMLGLNSKFISDF